MIKGLAPLDARPLDTQKDSTPGICAVCGRERGAHFRIHPHDMHWPGDTVLICPTAPTYREKVSSDA